MRIVSLTTWPLCLSLLVSAVHAANPATTDKTVPLKSDKNVRMLWAGSSSNYYHNAPKLVAESLTKLAGTPAESSLVGKSGTGVHIYLRPDFKAEYGLKAGQNVLDKIKDEKYDYLVLQAPAEFIVREADGAEFDKSLDIYCKAARDAGATPVFYEMGWGRDESAEKGRGLIFAAAVRNKIKLFAPCSTAWKRVRAERKDLDLQNPPDGAHPGTLGLYLNLCCYYAALTGKEPVGVPTSLRIWRKQPDERKAEIAELVKTTQFDAYDAQLPGWMRANVVAAKEEKIEPATADYLRKVAWEEYQAMQKRLNTEIK